MPSDLDNVILERALRERREALARADKAEAALADKEEEARIFWRQAKDARALAEELGQHLERAIDDLTGDWDELGGPQMDYLGANDALSRLEKSRE